MRPGSSRSGSCRPYFNPRTRVGCDAFFRIAVRIFDNFNPRTRVGCDVGATQSAGKVDNFNPRTRVGCDPANRQTQAPGKNFNPRTRVGCDCKLAQKPVSIYTSTIPLFTKCCQIDFLSSSLFPFPRQNARLFWCEPPGQFLCAWGSHWRRTVSPIPPHRQKNGLPTSLRQAALLF